MKTTIQDYGNGIFAIDQEMVRAFLLVGTENALLLDTGAVEADLRAYIGEITSLPVQTALTHSDRDHIENLHLFPEAYICEKDSVALQSNSKYKDVRLHFLEDGQTIDLGGRTLTVIFTPGHTEGSVCLLDKENKILFSGDTVSYGPVFMFGEGRSLKKYLQSLKMLDKMNEEGIFTSIYCCHNICPVPAAAIKELIACVEGVLNNTTQLTEATMPVPSKQKVFIAKHGQSAILVDGK